MSKPLKHLGGIVLGIVVVVALVIALRALKNFGIPPLGPQELPVAAPVAWRAYPQIINERDDPYIECDAEAAKEIVKLLNSKPDKISEGDTAVLELRVENRRYYAFSDGLLATEPKWHPKRGWYSEVVAQIIRRMHASKSPLVK